jgi:type IV pilus assembly protein PilY1
MPFAKRGARVNKREIFRKCVAWSLIATLINPAMMTPAFARDSDIYLNTTSGTSTAEPNVLFVLGTNDRMNVAEAWREYDPNFYDSHVEYLWNDTNVINTDTSAEVTAEDPNRISTAAPPTNPSSPWGTWSGALGTDRQALWKAVVSYAIGIQPGDPVIRSSRGTYRNYWNGSWLYWLPAGSDITTDKRLWSTSFNRFQAHIQIVPGVRGGVTFPAPPFPAVPAAAPPYTTADGATVDYRQFNLCNGSIDQLTPSTVFAPTNSAPNAGYYLNQQWVRYEPFLDLTAVNNPGANYPGNQTTVNGVTANKSTGPTTDTFFRGYVDGVSGAPTNTASVPPTNVFRDNWPLTTAAGASDNIGRQGQPIRIQGSSGSAGWTDLKADLGGFVFQSQVATPGSYFYPQAVLTNLRNLAYGGSYSLPTFTGSSALSREQFAAWLGNRDNATPPAFGNAVGTPAYYDVTVAGCDPTAGPLAANQCIQFGGTSGTITQACVGGGTVQQERDASTGIRFTGGTCTATGAPPVCTTTAGYTGTDLTNCPGIARPACTLRADPQDLFYSKFYEANCAFSGQSTVTVATCQWTGRQAQFVEGQGTYFYGGSCTESGSSLSCSAGGTTLTLNGVAQSNVVGPYPSPPPAAGLTTLGCDNTVAAGTYSYGGVCGGGTEFQMTGSPSTSTVTPPSPGARTLRVPTECTGPAGGASLSIRGGATQTYNQTCTNTAGNPGTGTCSAWYGTTCLVSNVPATYCPPAQNSGTIVAGNFYQAYKQQANQPNLYHECLADGPMLNPGGNSFPARNPRSFGTSWNNNTTADASRDPSAAYTTNRSQRVRNDPDLHIDVYSVNYLNWKFGAKACRDAAGNLITSGAIGAPGPGVTCSPIGRKTRLQVAKDALSGIVANTSGVRLGLMVYNKTDAALNSDGGNIVYAIRRMGSSATDTPAYNNRADLVKAIQNVVASSRTPLTETLYEAYRYFSGRAPKWGTSTTGAKGGGNVSQGRELSVGANVDPPDAAGNVFVTNAGGKYNSPMLNNPNVADPANCQKNYIVMITNGQPEEDFSANADIKTMSWVNPTGNTVSPRTDLDTNGARPSNAGPPDYQQIPTVSGGSPYGPTDLADPTGINDGGYVWLDELTYFMANSDVSPGANNGLAGDPVNGDLISGRQSIVTYTIGFAGVSAPVVKNAADTAQGVFYVAQNAQQLQSALVSAFVAIRNFNPTAAAATVPISSLNRGESSTDVYLAFFGPSASKSTWPGTVKKYQLSTSPADCGAGIPLCLTGQSVIASTGLKNIETTDPVTSQTIVDPTASSGPNADGTAWTPASVQDGPKPDKGGTGYVLINTTGYTPDTRKVYTYLSGGVSSSVNLTAAGNQMHFNNSAITKTLLGNAGMTNAQQETLINYIRGGNDDPRCTDGSGATTCDTWSAWPHFGTEHSTPAIVTYDSSTAPPVQYLYYVQNNGMLTAVDANTGKEKWSFLIEEALPQLSTMQANSPGPEIYVADGSPTVFFDDQNSNGKVDGSDRVWLYFGLRRGGRAMYAIDITQKDAPSFKWKITANSGTGKVCNGTSACSTVSAFDELGQTWSTPSVVRLNKFPNIGDPPALIFGGGYDADAEDTVPAEFSKARSMGRALYVINGDTAALIQAWGSGPGKSGAWNSGSGGTTTMSYSIPSDVTAISTDFDPFVDRVYVGDMGGNIWRFDVTDKDENNWRAEQLASLSNPSGEKRKFFFPPAVAPQSQPFAFSYDAVYIGSGDKEHPSLSSTSTPATTDDRMFMLMDDPSAKSGGGTPSTSGVSALATPITLSTLFDISNTATVGVAGVGVNPTDLIGKQGWMRGLENGEKVVNSPTVFFGRLRFGTYAPLNVLNACTPPGEGRLNEIDSLSGSLFQLNTASAMGANQRWYGGFLSRGYMSPTQLLVLPTGASGKTKTVFTFTCADANCSGQNILTLGAPTKVYWYMEPEQ